MVCFSTRFGFLKIVLRLKKNWGLENFEVEKNFLGLLMKTVLGFTNENGWKFNGVSLFSICEK